MHKMCVNTPEHSKNDKLDKWTSHNIQQYKDKINQNERHNETNRKYVYIYIYIYRNY